MAVITHGSSSFSRRRIIFLLIILVAVVVAAFHFSAAELIDRRLREWFPSLSPGLSIEWSSLEIQPFSMGIRFKQIGIHWENPREPGTSMDFKAETLDVEGINLAGLLIAGNLSLGEVQVRDWSCVVSGGIGDIFGGGFSGISPKNITVGKWMFRAGRFSWSDNQNHDGVEARLQNLRLETNRPQATPIILQLTAGPVRFGFPAAMADVNAEKIEFNKANRCLEVLDLGMVPRWPENEFAIRKGFQTDRIAFHIEKLKAYWKGENITIPDSVPHRVVLRNPGFEVFRDRRIHRKPGPRKPKLLPYQLLRKIPFSIHIPEIHIENGEINYAEHQQGAPRPGRLFFSRFSASISGFQAGPVKPGSPHPVKMEFSCRFQGQVPFSGTFDMHTGKPEFRFSGKLGAMELPGLNSLLIPMAFLRIAHGKMDGAQWNLEGNDHHLTGWMKARYQKLRFTLLKHQKSLQKRGLATFLVNLLIFRNNPEPGEPMRTARIHLERNPLRGFFNWVWRGLLEGLKRSAGI